MFYENKKKWLFKNFKVKINHFKRKTLDIHKNYKLKGAL